MNAILFSLVLFATPAQEPVTTTPLSIDREVVDLGAVKAGPPLSAQFQLKHTGSSGTLTFTGVETGCGCLKTSASRLTLSPGESSIVSVDINSMTQPEGANSWRFVIHTKFESPGAKPIVDAKSLLVKAKLEREIIVTPPMIAFSTSNEASQLITLTDKRPNGSIRVTHAVSTSSHLKATIQTNGTVLVELASTAPADGKTYSEILTLVTNDQSYSELRIPVSLTKTNPTTMALNPDRFLIRFSGGDTSKSGVVQLRDGGGKPIAITSATTTQAGVTVTFSPGSNPISTVKATVDLKLAGASGTADVFVQLNSPSPQSLTIPLVWKSNP